MHKIFPEDFRHYTTLVRACRIGQSYEIEARFGQLKFDFKEFPQIKNCTIHLRRKGGNGSIIISSGENIINTNILSRTSQYFSIELAGSVLEIKRPDASIGIVELLEIELDIEEQTGMSSQWKKILSRCKEYKHVHISQDCLYASEGGGITASNIIAIQTKPPNMFSIIDNTVKFLGSCEIVLLEVSGSPRITSTNYLPHMDPPAQIYTPPVYYQQPAPIVTQKTQQHSPQIKPTVNNMLYDSTTNSYFKGVKTSGIVSVLDRAVKLGHTGSITIPISSIQPLQNYIVTVEVQSIVGNGKICFSIQPSSTAPTVLFANSQVRRLQATISSDKASDGPFNLVIGRPASATGEVIITRVVLLYNPAIGNPVSMVMNSKVVIDLKPSSPAFNYDPTLNKLNSIPVASDVKLKINTDRKFVIVIPSYNNKQWVERNLISALNQNYSRFRTIFVDDFSSDDTFEIAKQVVKNSGKTNVALVRNENRMGALANLYNAIHSCDDDEIILTLDGDDWLAHDNVLEYLNNIYKNGDIWLTYGQYKNHPDGGCGVSQPIPDHITASNGFRQYKWCASHLRTFYSWLFKKIDRNDLLMPNGTFYPMTWDFAIMFPMLEMAGKHSKFIGEILYVYNLENPINDHKVNRQLQAQLDGTLRAKKKYGQVNISTTDKQQIGLLLIATNKYRMFLPGMIESADQHFFNNDKYDVTYFIFTDDTSNELSSRRKIVQIHINHRPFPYASMDRFRHFTNNKAMLLQFDYLFYSDVDAKFVGPIGEEILGSTVGVRHCGFYSGGGSFETNQSSTAYLPREKYKYYYGGGFSGGETRNYLFLSEWCADKLDEDQKNGIIPCYHDETILNTFFALNSPEKSLDPSYHYPETVNPEIRRSWGGSNFTPKILLLNKNHHEIRQ